MKIDPKMLRMVVCHATATPLGTATDDDLSAVRAAFEQGGPPVITDGSPTVMRMTAWMAHEGMNRNRLAFVAEELKVAAAKVSVTNPLVMDFNHSAIHGFDGEQRCIGVWHAAEYAFDQKAKGGQGAWGILVQGVMFAWLFPDIADALQAEQGRKGYIEFSMACIPGSIEFAVGDDGRGFEIAHNPIFFTNSALDVPPADADAKGLGTEQADMQALDKQREQLLQTASEGNPTDQHVQEAARAEEVAMNEEMKALLAGLEATLAQKFEETLSNDAAVRMATVEALETKLAEVETALAAARAEAEAAVLASEGVTLALEAVEAEKAELAAKLAEFEAVAAASARAEKLASRLASLPEKVREAHAGRDAEKRARLENKWVAMSDEDWAVYLEDELGIATASAATSYLDRSNREVIPASGSQTQSLGERARRFIRK